MSSFPVFKVNYLIGKNNIKKIIVFYGLNLEVPNPNDLFKTDPTNEVFKTIFYEDELTNIQAKNIEVIFVTDSIHIDDSIGTIKLKISNALTQPVSVSQEEIYVYCLKHVQLNPITVYQSLTLNDKIPITRVRLDQLLLNVRKEDGSAVDFGVPDKDKYTFDDILKLDLPNLNIYLAKILGQKIIMGTNEYPLVADPFYIEKYDILLERSRKEMSTMNNSLLLDTCIVYRNNIYLCLAQDVFEYCEQGNISSEQTSKLYYPFLYKLDINDLDGLETNKQSLISDTATQVTNSLLNVENINMFYDVYKYKHQTELFTLNVKKTGIKNIKIIMHPEYTVKIPIDVIFKLLHASKENALIKYNPATRQENIYRLYANKLSTDGRKIPYLPKAVIFKLVKNIGKTKTVSVYVQVSYENTLYTFVCEFEENGYISIYSFGDFENVIVINNNDFTVIDRIISLTINPIIDQIKSFFEQSGYNMIYFNSINDDNVQIQEIQYQTVYHITKSLDLYNNIGCISSVFNMETQNVKTGIEMRYKRVSNFNKHDSQEAFVIEKQKQRLSNDEIAEQLVENYEDVTIEQAYEIIDKLINELQVTRGTNKKRAIEIKVNPGFKTTLQLQGITSEVFITVNNINDIYYLYTIPIYLDTMIRITQDINSTQYNIQNIRRLCSGKEIEDVAFNEITATAEEAFPDNEVAIIEDGDTIIYPEISYENPEDIHKMNDLLDILGYGDESSDEIIEGGAKTSSDDSMSIESDVLSTSSASLPTNNKNASLDSLGSLGSIGSNLEGDVEGLEDLEDSKINDLQEELIKLKISETKKPISFEIMKSEPEEPMLAEEVNIAINPNINDSNKILTSPIEEEIMISPNIIQESDKDIVKDSDKATSKLPVQPLTKEIIKPVVPQLENTVKNIEGLRLNNPYLFQERLEEKDPNLFLTLKDGKFDGYSRMCPSSTKRQPVILTKEELAKMASDNPGALMGKLEENGEYAGPDVIKYGSNPDKQFYYMCPRYWCLLTNTALTEEQIRQGVCGGKDAIIPKGDKVVKKGKSIYQFYDDKTTHFPGFHKETTSDGLCVPCCYDSWNKPAQIGRRQKCKIQTQEDKAALKGKENENEGNANLEEEPIVAQKDQDQYVKGPEKYPLGNNRWGYLPFAIQKFFNESNIECQISKTNTNIKPFHTCLLRHGVENNINQSFIACIANALFYADKDEKTKKNKITRYIPDAKYDIPSIEIMKQLIMDAIDIDKFITYQNGDLVTVFASPELQVDESLYYNSRLYAKIQQTKTQTSDESNNLLFFKKVVQSFENFKLFLKNNKIYIDYTYLWDIICKPNPRLFENGINMIILEILDNDVTNNVELICPTNHYSNHFYDPRKRTLIIVKHDQFFEPIYSYRNEETKISIVKTFSEYDSHLSKSLRSIFRKIIKPVLKDKCGAFASSSNIYKFKRPPLLDDLILELTKSNYKIEKQVLNFQGKVVGVTAESPNGMRGFIPCYPSSLTSLKKDKDCTNLNECQYDFVYMTDNIWFPYTETLEFLKTYYKYKEPEDGAKGKCIDGTDLCKVIEDNMVVGFLTKTNQFVQISQPLPISEINDNVRTVTSNNYLIADIETQTMDNVDHKRVDYIKRIELETAFYNVFRNTMRILLNDYINSDKRKEIQEECNKQFVIYDVQLEKIILLLKSLANDYIVFAMNGQKYDYKTISDVYACISLSKDKCSDNPICMVTNDKCSIVLPKENLLTGTDNETYYYGKMADELIRYRRIKSFIFQPQSYLSFGQLKYNLRNDEMIILQSLLTQEFFENLVPADVNLYAKYNTYDSTEPILAQPYTNEVILNENNYAGVDRDCFPSKPEKITSSKWKSCFPSDYKEIDYKGSKFCGLYLIIDIIKGQTQKNVSPDDLRDILFEQYKKYTGQFEKTNVAKIADIWIEQGKVDEGNDIKSGSLNILEIIVSETYYITNFDIWLLLEYFKIPSIFISSFHIPETRFTDFQFVCYSDIASRDDTYVFIVVPAFKDTKHLSYKIIVNSENKMDISINDLSNTDCINKLRQSLEKTITIPRYMESFKRDNNSKTKTKTKQNIEFEIEEQLEAIPVKQRKPRAKKLNPTLILVNEAEQEVIEIVPKKKRTRKQPTEIILGITPAKPTKKTRKQQPPV